MCTEIFDSQKELERHILSEKHTTSAHTTSMNTIRASYVEKIKLSSQLHSSCSISNVILAEFDVSAGIKQAPLMARIVEQGWALPQRVNFRYTYEQTFLLYTIFMEGEKTGKKMSPEEVEMLGNFFIFSTFLSGAGGPTQFFRILVFEKRPLYLLYLWCILYPLC